MLGQNSETPEATKMFQQLSGKKVVVIGASSGIGLAVAKKSAELGA